MRGGGLALFGFCLRRAVLSRRALALVILAAFMAVIVAGFRIRGVRPETAFFVKDVVVHALCEVFVVLAAVAFGTGVWDEERQAGTLETLLSRPLGRVRYFTLRLVAALLTTVLIVGLTYVAMAVAGAPDAQLAWQLLPAPLFTALALMPLFALFGVVLPRPAICALLWGFFLEILIANMPGVIKGMTVNFYSRSLVASAAKSAGIDPASIGVITHSGDVAELVSELEPVSGATAMAVLGGFGLLCAVLGALASRRASVVARAGD